MIWGAAGPLFGYSDTWQLIIKHSDDDHHVPHGVPDPEHAELARRAYALKARRPPGARTGRLLLRVAAQFLGRETEGLAIYGGNEDAKSYATFT